MVGALCIFRCTIMEVTFYTSPMLSHPLLWFYFRADLPNPSLWPRFSLTSHCHKRTAKWQLQFSPHVSCCGPSFTCRAMTLRRKFSTITGYIQIFGDCQFESLVVNHGPGLLGLFTRSGNSVLVFKYVNRNKIHCQEQCVLASLQTHEGQGVYFA